MASVCIIMDVREGNFQSAKNFSFTRKEIDNKQIVTAESLSYLFRKNRNVAPTGAIS